LNDRVSYLLSRVGLPPGVANMFPHQLSGGMKQRVVIAIAISLRPRVIIADELTSALDVVVQRQVMETLKSVQSEIGASVLLVGHDMGLMAQFVERLAVMYAGRIMEIAPVRDIFRKSRHPYTQLLITSLPSTEEKGEFQGIPGLPPSLIAVPTGCVFHTRCPYAVGRCRMEVPQLRQVGADLGVLSFASRMPDSTSGRVVRNLWRGPVHRTRPALDISHVHSRRGPPSCHRRRERSGKTARPHVLGSEATRQKSSIKEGSLGDKRTVAFLRDVR
jgi:oligopeptide/dipeptide ABC transporter ATP-binding protein